MSIVRDVDAVADRVEDERHRRVEARINTVALTSACSF